MSPQPYGSAAKAYLAAGYWPLPLPPRKKASPPEGYTGRDGLEIGSADVGGWILTNRTGNIGLRLPRGVAGIDVDAYKDDQHAAAWAELTGRLGALPDAPCCTSRDDGISGIRLFRVPEDWEAAGRLPEDASGVSPGEVIQWHHRYVVCPPSIHPVTGKAYRWRSGAITPVAALPALPDAWLRALNGSAPHPTCSNAENADKAPQNGHPIPPAVTRQSDGSDERPGDEFNERADWMNDILGPHGWELHHETGGTRYVTRPGKNRRDGHSATIGHSGDGVERLYVFSADAAPFEMEVPYTKFGAWALLNCGGDYQAAARELSRAGYGRQPAPPAVARRSDESDEEAPWPDEQAAAPATRVLAVTDLEPGGGEVVPPPELICADMLYRGAVHTLTGPPDCGKTTLACWWMLRAVRDGGSVLFLDEEGGREIIMEKFQALGAEAGERIGYIPFPSRSWNAGDIAMLSDILAERQPALVAWDSSAAFLARAGLDENSAADVTRFYAQVLTPAARLHGAAVLVVDHDTKNSEPSRYGRGSGAKLAATDVAYKMTLVRPFSKLDSGMSKLTVSKDRRGWLHRNHEVAFLAGGAVPLALTFGETSGGGDLAGLGPAERKIAEVLDDMPATVRELTDRVAQKHGHGLYHSTVTKALQRLMEVGLADQFATGARNEGLWIAASRPPR